LFRAGQEDKAVDRATGYADRAAVVILPFVQSDRPSYQFAGELRAWYCFVRRRTRGLRRLCITVLSVASAVDRVVSLSAKFFSGPTCWNTAPPLAGAI